MIAQLPNLKAQVKMAHRAKKKIQEFVYKKPSKGLDDLEITHEIAYLDNGEKFLLYDSSKLILYLSIFHSKHLYIILPFKNAHSDESSVVVHKKLVHKNQQNLVIKNSWCLPSILDRIKLQNYIFRMG